MTEPTSNSEFAVPMTRDRVAHRKRPKRLTLTHRNQKHYEVKKSFGSLLEGNPKRWSVGFYLGNHIFAISIGRDYGNN